KLYFQGYDGAEYKEHDDPTFGYYNELFVYDGVNAPRIVTNLRVGASASPSFIASVNNELLMYANNGSTGNELFKLSGDVMDSDSDSVADVYDAFPNDAAASADTDGDGYPDVLVEGVETALVVDAFPLDAAASMDDGDGYPDAWNEGATAADSTTGLVLDQFPADGGVNWTDSDGDGVGDNTDAFPAYSGASVDADGDGYPDSYHDGYDHEIAQGGKELDQFLGNSAEWSDVDLDGVGDNSDAFPLDAAASIDTDGDGYPDVLVAGIDTDLTVDAFVNDVTESTDTDMDGIGDNTDSDIDGDGVLNAVDANPLVAVTRENDLDRDGVDDSEDDYVDLLLAKAAIEATVESSGGNISMNATGIDTKVTDKLATLINVANIPTTVSFKSVVDGELKQSGLQDVGIVLTNLVGSEQTLFLPLAINPLATTATTAFSKTGEDFAIDVNLTGVPVDYPVTFSYQLIQVNTVLVEGTLSIDEGLSTALEFDGVNDGNYAITIEDENGLAVFANGKHEVNLTVQQNTRPSISTGLMFNDKKVTVVESSVSSAFLAFDIFDADMDSSHNVIITIDGEEVFNGSASMHEVIEINPEQLGVGSHTVVAKVVETDTTDLFEASQTSRFFITEALPELSTVADSDNDGISDADEGMSDSDGDGIADYLDNANLLANQQKVGDTIISVEEGLTISIGQTVKAIDNGHSADAATTVAEIEAALNVEIDDSDVTKYVTPIIDFEVHGADVGSIITMIVPLNEKLPVNAQYRKLKSDGSFVSFEVTDTQQRDGDSIWSAVKTLSGECPAADDTEAWSRGLVQGSNCIKLRITDGGVNDDDGVANGVVVDPAVIVAVNNAPVVELAREIQANENTYVEIVASATDLDSALLAYSWTQVEGSAVELLYTTGDTISFVTPSTSEGEELKFTLQVTDGVRVTTKSITVVVANSNTAPTVTASSSVSETEIGGLVTLSALGLDTENDDLTYSWSTATSNVVLANADTATASFNAPTVTEDTTINFEVLVSDGEMTATANVSVLVKAAKEEKDEGLLGLSFSYTLATLLGGFVAFRRRIKK
ncbi:choice-of-anchor U domain-containing protein, partial [Psychrosphaera sp. 1_MG-2023]|uniref:choice-of-anchor U domain-containing protein n=1 Tax=Psychrosphaera sp. 1_MG-2023 TaxID=3062643 RepID=UPI0026E1C773